MGVFVCLLVFVISIALAYYIAKWFYEVAEEKGYHNKKYFWICFLWGAVGIPLIIALPDRGNQKNEILTDELPEL